MISIRTRTGFKRAIDFASRGRLVAAALMLPLALGVAGCGESAVDAGHDNALDDASTIAREVEVVGAHAGGDPGSPEYQPPVDNAGLVRLIEQKVRNHSGVVGVGRVLTSRSKSGWDGELAVVDAVLYTTGASGGGWSYEDADVTTCIRFRINGTGGQRAVTAKQFRCPALPEPSPPRPATPRR